VFERRLLGKWYEFGHLIFPLPTGIFSIFTTFRLLQEQPILHRCSSEKWLSPLATKFWKLLWGEFFPHCHLFHHRALLSGSSVSDEKLLLGLKGFVFIGDNLTKSFKEL